MCYEHDVRHQQRVVVFPAILFEATEKRQASTDKGSCESVD
jgi:hypothetical protein